MRCKMTLNSFTPGGENEQAEMTFMAVADGSPENESFFKYTPYGELKLGVVNPEAVKDLKIGKSYYIDISEAPK